MIARTLSSLFLAATLGITGGLSATAQMEPLPSHSTATVSVIGSPMTQSQIETAQAPTLAAKKAGPLDRMGRVARNKLIRSWGGIAPCTHEDGSGQVLPCYWNGKVRGNKTGLSYIMMPSKGDDPRQVIIARG
jgi:hypothetical protein